jgi:hypothetical protein
MILQDTFTPRTNESVQREKSQGGANRAKTRSRGKRLESGLAVVHGAKVSTDLSHCKIWNQLFKYDLSRRGSGAGRVQCRQFAGQMGSTALIKSPSASPSAQSRLCDSPQSFSPPAPQ